MSCWLYLRFTALPVSAAYLFLWMLECNIALVEGDRDGVGVGNACAGADADAGSVYETFWYCCCGRCC